MKTLFTFAIPTHCTKLQSPDYFVYYSVDTRSYTVNPVFYTLEEMCAFTERLARDKTESAVFWFTHVVTTNQHPQTCLSPFVVDYLIRQRRHKNRRLRARTERAAKLWLREHEVK